MKKCILIIGTSQGLGLSLLKQFAIQNVDIIAIDKEKNEALPEQYPQVLFKYLNITDKKSVNEAIITLSKEGKLPDVIIFSAAIHIIDNDPFIDSNKFSEIIDVDMMSVFYFLSTMMPLLKKPAVFVFCSSGVVIFPNPANIGYFLSKLAVTKAFDHFMDRYKSYDFKFKSVILGPLYSTMLSNSRPPKGLVNVLRNLTCGTPEIAAKKIIGFIDNSRRRMYYKKSSAIILWLARFAQFLLPRSMKFYQVIKG